MAKKKLQPKKQAEDSTTIVESNGDVAVCSVERTLEELLFVNVDYKDIDKLRKLRRINKRKQIDIIKKLKECMKEAI